MTRITDTIESLSKLEEKLRVKQMILLNKAYESDDPTDLIKAQSLSQKIFKREESERKSFLVDPNDVVTSLGYKHKRLGLSYEVLKRMATTPIINAIIKTRINQIASFAEPQKDRFSTGFIITKKNSNIDSKLSKKDQLEANRITDIVLNCGVNNSWSNDDFDTFTRKLIKDSLIYDQMTFEVVSDRRGNFFEAVATDASTFRIADTYDDEEYKHRRTKSEMVNGYYPSYVQILEQNVINEYYPWELCFGIRNPDTSVNNHGYGTSELEELIQVITAILWSDEYNRKFFSQGSAPKGLLRVDSSVSPGKLQEFKRQWQAMTSGVYNAWKTPILEAGKMDFVNLQTNNRDMEYSKWIEYLVKTACSIYAINPEEVNFSGTGSGAKTVFESDNENKLKHSKDKGLQPLLKFYQAKLNKSWIERINPEFCIKFVGYDAVTREQELDMIVKKTTNLLTLDEGRELIGYKPLNIEGVSDCVQSGIFSQLKMQNSMGEQGGEQQEEFDDSRDGMEVLDDDESFDDRELNEEVNPFE